MFHDDKTCHVGAEAFEQDAFMGIDPIAVLNDPSSSNWLIHALHTALLRDPVDAVHDAETLMGCLAYVFAQYIKHES